MGNRTTGIVATLATAIFLATFTSSALAGNGTGKVDGNSANAPGHNKDSASAQVSASTQASAQGSASQNSATTAGMKPTNSTSKNTKCTTGGGGGSAATCAPDSSNTAAVQMGTKDASKRYGNGSTAAQIATSNGAAAGTPLFGPGNSQPHKVQACGKANGHWVDAHAVKDFSSAKCSASSSTGTQTSAMTSLNGATTVTATAGTKAHGNGRAVGQSTGGVLGVTASTSAGTSGNGPMGGVLGALTTIGHGTLPFTGFPLWAAVALALMIIVLGLGLRRVARARV